ncbi:hypothetical protein ACP4OV_031663 [Aristida adscensionis]
MSPSPAPLLFLLLAGAAAATDTLRQGQSLLSGAATLVSSPSGVFELGFFAPDPKLPSRLYLGIWHRATTPRTVIWVANRASPATTASPSLALTAAGELRVLDGAALLWSSNTPKRAGAMARNYSAVLQDSGSLQVLAECYAEGETSPLWDSFWHPTDTLLSGMTISVMKPGREPPERMLFTSWASETDPSPGRYAFGLDPADPTTQLYIWKDGNVTLWRSGQWTGQNFVGFPWRPLRVIGFKQSIDQVLGTFYTFTAANTSLERFVLAPNGTDIWYMMEKSSQWETVWMQPSNECEYYGKCGANAKCTVVQDGKAECTCLKGFQPPFLDQWTARNWSEGCVRNPPLDCQVNASGDGFLALPNIKYPDFSYWVSTVSDEAGCKTACQNNCSCGAYVYNTAIGCLAWGNELIDIYEFQDGGSTLNLKLPASKLRVHHATWKIATLIVGSGASSILLALIAIFMTQRFKHLRVKKLKQQYFKQNRGQLLQQLVSQKADIAEKMIIPLDELAKATNNFDKARELGDGGHGTVYKGILSDQHVVAIKKSKITIQREIDEFINEVAILSQVNHRNVVKLFGCCLETEVPLLVYEFISNGTLYQHLHVEGPRSLTWGTRLRIATETSSALAYLHSSILTPIIHRDIKSSNILLDDTLTSKVSDFGASRYIPIEKTGLTTRVQGTIGYLDPMYFYTSRLNEKSDVYSFGVMLVELLTRKKPFSYLSSHDEGLVSHFISLLDEGNLAQILDPQVTEEGGKEVQEVAILAASCVKLAGEERPVMQQVELALKGIAARRIAEKGMAAVNCSSTEEGQRRKESSRRYTMEQEFLFNPSYPR